MWPQVALTHHAKLSKRIEPHLANPVNLSPQLGDVEREARQ